MYDHVSHRSGKRHILYNMTIIIQSLCRVARKGSLFGRVTLTPHIYEGPKQQRLVICRSGTDAHALASQAAAPTRLAFLLNSALNALHRIVFQFLVVNLNFVSSPHTHSRLPDHNDIVL